MNKHRQVLLLIWLVLSLLLAQCAPAAATPPTSTPTSPAADSTSPYPPPSVGQPAHTSELPTPLEVPPTSAHTSPYPPPPVVQPAYTPEQPVPIKTIPISAATSTPRSSPTPPDYQVDTGEWIWYRNDALGYEFKYPPKLQLVEQEDVVILNHSIEYENCGDCDMRGYCDYHERLDDFNVSFEVIHNHIEHDLYGYDYAYHAGMLEGYWIYQGAQGCGDFLYYFPLGDEKT
ncbi:MAG: hypothetical protein IBX69_19300, partial [Anaerolineales bacterium]|nr:hypothetical protein [Anaerolineales bacterium]